jgi:hypothetical protein
MGLFRKIFGNKKPDNGTDTLVKTSQMLDEDLYWQIINESLLNSNNQDEQQEYLTKHLQNLTPGEIIGFKLRTDKLLFDTYNPELWCAGYIINGGCSDDAFEYFRRWIISRGRDVFYNAKNNPDSLVTEISDEIDYYDFESLSEIPNDAFEAKTLSDIYEYIDEVNFRKIVGPYPEIKFNWEEEDPQSMQTICPKLFEKKWK